MTDVRVPARIAVLVMSALLLSPSRHVYGQQAGDDLPVVDIHVDETVLARLLAYPYSGEEAEARISTRGISYDCRIRLRGNTSRDLPKPSWRVELESEDNVFGGRVLIFRAEYRDESYMRNHLMHRLFGRLGMAAPETRFLNLRMNGRPAGVYLEVERIDDEFLANRDLPRGDLLSVVLHAGRWYPYMHYADFLTGWEPRTLTAGAYERIAHAAMKTGFSSYDDFPDHVRALFDVEQILRYYAVVYAVMGSDAVTDNYYLYRNPESGLFQFIPWDLDATLGIAFDGQYEERNETATTWFFFNSVLLQRMLEYEEWQTEFAENVRMVAGAGFDFLRKEIGLTSNAIRAAVYADQSKANSGARFDAAVEQLEQFLERRQDVLENHDPFVRIPIRSIRTSNPFPTPENPVATIETQSTAPQNLQVWLAYDIEIFDWSSRRKERFIHMNDEGVDGDRLAGDGWYAVTVDLSAHMGDLVTVGILNDRYSPAATVFNASFIQSATYTFNLTGASASDFHALQFEEVNRAGEDEYASFVNDGEEVLDLSSFFFQAGPYYQRMPIPWETLVEPEQRLVIASNLAAARRRFPQAVVVGGLAFDVSTSDTLRLLSPMQTPVSRFATTVTHVTLPRVIINEINYHSHEGSDTGDWLELYNPGDETVWLSGWQVLDGDDDHVFVLPSDAMLSPGAFAVVAENASRLRGLTPAYVPVYGNIGFGFDAAGELVRLRNDVGELITVVDYGDESPWPSEADGEGPTLELIRTAYDGTLAEHWSASITSGGTPGEANSVAIDVEPVPAPPELRIGAVYPNPANEVVMVEIDLPVRAEVEVSLLDVLGRRLERKTMQLMAGARQIMTLDLTTYASGTYFISIKADGHVATRSVAHVR